MLVAAGIMACSSEEETYDPRNAYHEAEHTVLIYMAGENNLSDYTYNDLKEIKEGSRHIGDNNLVIYIDRSNRKELPWLARIKDGQYVDSVSIADMGISETDIYSSDSDVFESVLRYAFNHYKARKGYGLILWGHSTGWMIDEEVPTTRAYGVDNGSNNSNLEGYWINIPTMRQVLEQMPHLDFIFADCCNFMCLEVLYELRSVTDYIIGSPAEIPGNGAPYDKVIPKLFLDDIEQAALQSMDLYHESENNLLLSVAKTSKMEDAAAATRTALQEITATLNGGYADMTGAIHYYYLGSIDNDFSQGYNMFYDAGDFIRRNASEAAYTAWKEVLDQAIIGKYYAKQWMTCKQWNEYFSDFTMKAENYHGVSMFVPQDPTKDSNFSDYSKYNNDIMQMAWYDAVWK